MLFTILDCGYTPRSAEETDNVNEPRIEKIYRLINQSRYAIHDLSRTELDHHGLPRFNMPLELGIFLGAQHFGKGKQRTKACLVFDKRKYRYQKFVSDISGQDVQAHGNTVRRVVKLTRNWLRARTRESMPSHGAMVEHYSRFNRGLPVFCQDLNLDAEDLTFNDFIFVAGEWLTENI